MRLTKEKSLQHLKEIRDKHPEYTFSTEELIYEKLGKLEDIETQLGYPLENLIEELNFIKNETNKKEQPKIEDLYLILKKYTKAEKHLECSLDVVIKALQNGIYTNVYSGICYVGLYENYFQVSDDYVVYLKDYKITWWLKEDRSE